jgi:hypothetical protein
VQDPLPGQRNFNDLQPLPTAIGGLVGCRRSFPHRAPAGAAG